MTHHRVKAIPSQFKSIKYEGRCADNRNNDRDYQKHDVITYCEYSGGTYSGDEVSARIGHLDDFGFRPGYVNLSLYNVGALVVD